MRVLVCGGREYDDWEKVLDTLNNILEQADDGLTIIQGGAKGADFLAKVWAKYTGCPQEEFKADVKKYGSPAAFFIRNQEMLDKGKPNLVVAFPGGRGTADMVERAQKAGVEVLIV